MNLQSTVSLNNGVEMPLFGLGTFKSEPGNETEQAVRSALEIGYRHVDTAAIYGNEADVGRALEDSGIDRTKIFVTTKLWNSEQGYETAFKAFDESRKKLQLDVVDLYLVHWPANNYRESWKALEKLYSDGKIRAIGVSNFMVHHLEDLKNGSDMVPAVNQVEFHPFLLQKPLLDYDRENGIQHEAWSPLTRGRKFDHPVVQELAVKYGKSPAQIFIRWDLELSVVTIPKSANEERIKENSEVFNFSISEDDMRKLNGLDADERIGPHPDNFGV